MTTPNINIAGFAKLLQAHAPLAGLALESADSFNLSDWTQGPGKPYWKSTDDGENFAWPLNDAQDLTTHYLVATARISPADRETFINGISCEFETIATTINRQLHLTTELDAMARELAARYEELNLVYYTDDEVRFLDEGRQALSSLVENCNEYLSVDLTAFVMPDQGLCLVKTSDGDPIDPQAVLPAIVDSVFEALQTDSRTIVMNNVAESEAAFGFRYPIVASPIHDGNAEVAGVLVIMRQAHASDFVNSDRNLLMVMSGKAAKIIQSSYDNLTGLMRQEGFDRCLASALAHAQYSDQKHALLHVNIDRMHLINDTIGYQAGDRILQAVAHELRSKLRDSDRIARLGGDEFGILVHGCSMKQGEVVAEKLCQAVASLKVESDDEIIDVSACIGVATLDKESDTTVSAHAGAEIACSVAKERGRNRWHIYHQDDPALVERKQQMEWVGRIKDAIGNDQLRLFSQRIMPLAENADGYHFEILVRMVDKDGSILSPGLFLPVAERYQMMPALDRWVVDKTLSSLLEIAPEMIEQNIACSINLSGQTLVDQDFLSFVAQKFEATGIPPSLICFEVTETAAIANLEEAQRFMHDLRSLGCSFALDDFGVGLSSFAYLRTLPVDYLKIDGSFVKPIVGDETAAAMLTAMNQIGKIVGLKTVAEFVEDKEIIDCLKEIGVDYGQGYGISRPRPLGEELSEIRLATAVPA